MSKFYIKSMNFVFMKDNNQVKCARYLHQYKITGVSQFFFFLGDFLSIYDLTE